ncbi:DNA-binding transcriptional MerR regulator [Kribbella sp. VKM Ac-2527]|uniref:DNA-binding transcriptional MerR regulator n=1 Tax=Kribbella caucasensis TaxID=2512215 RepID=A0A4R6J5R9_9ACTN|nr:MerR family transcriptional regulator [Kribbella sp. VKM Ac-2527]TDO30407.1 DNA-binding transcriptional MerR regulator [Kribbella sp. VKM Ac-2527]
MTMTRNGSRLMTVRDLSRRTGVPIKNLRDYTDRGLIYTVGRSPSNYRLYDADALWCVRWIGTLRGLGLTMAEIRDLTAAHARRSFGPQLAERLQTSRRRLQARITQLEETVQRIDEFEASYHADLASEGEACWDSDPRCPIDPEHAHR